VAHELDRGTAGGNAAPPGSPEALHLLAKPTGAVLIDVFEDWKQHDIM
jgi:hypothetical protein